MKGRTSPSGPRERSTLAMNVAVVGKGGCGKTSISGTMARVLARRGHRVLAIDGDPNPNLALTLGSPSSGSTRCRRSHPAWSSRPTRGAGRP